MGRADDNETKQWWAAENRRLARYESADEATQLRAEDAPVAQDMRYQLALQRLELKAAQIIAELGMEEIARRVEELHVRNRVAFAQQREYHTARKAAQAAHEPPPPNPQYDPDGWRQWQYTRAFLHQSHN